MTTDSDESGVVIWPEGVREYRILAVHGQQSIGCGTRDEAVGMLAWWDREYPASAPHRLLARPMPQPWQEERP